MTAAVRILIVDDQRAVRDVLAGMLALDGYEVRSASHGREALELIGREPVDLVLLDVQMPGMDGWTVFAELRALDPQLRVVVISDGRYQDEARSRGVSGFISKPYRRAELQRVVADTLASSPPGDPDSPPSQS